MPTRAPSLATLLLLTLLTLAPLPTRAAQSDALPGVDDETYESPTYGYTLEWDDRDWEVVDATTDTDDGDILVLTNGVSTLYITGLVAYDGDADECSIDAGEVVASPDAADLYPSESGDRTLDPEDYSYLVDCRELVEDGAVLLIVHVFPADELGNELVEAEAVTETLGLSNGSSPGGGREPSDDHLAAAGVDGNTYESPEFGYTLEWDADVWDVGGASADPDVTLLNLVNDGGSLIISGIAGLGDAESCLETAVEFYSTADDVDDWELFEDEDGDPIEGGTRRRAFAAYAHTALDDNGDSAQYVNYIECRRLDAPAAILISHLTTERAYHDQAELRDDLLDTLVLP